MMKRLFYIFLLVFVLMGCSTSDVVTKRFDDSDIIHFSEMKSDKDLVNKVVYLNAGDQIPVDIQVDSSVLGIEDKSVNLVLKKKIFFRLVMPEELVLSELKNIPENKKQQILKRSMIYLSSDALKWAKYTEFKAIEKLLGIGGGSFSMAFGITKKDGPKLSLLAITRNVK